LCLIAFAYFGNIRKGEMKVANALSDSKGMENKLGGEAGVSENS